MTTTTPDRKYVEIEYSMDAETAAITRGMAESGKDFEHPVHLYLTDGGLLASVTIESDDLGYAEAIDMALDLAYDEIDRYIPQDEDITEPWRVLMVDHDLMAENLRRAPLSPVSQPSAPVQD